MDSYKDLTFKDFLNHNARDFIREKLMHSDAELKEGGYDEFGTDLETSCEVLAVMLFFYRFISALKRTA